MAVSTKGSVLLREAVEAARTGDRVVARTLLREILANEPDNEQAWLWRAAVAETIDESMSCLGEVLRINPSNRQALGKLAQHRLIGVRGPESAAPKPPVAAEPVPKPTKTCPYCSHPLEDTASRCIRCAAVLTLADPSAFTDNRGLDEGILRQAAQRIQQSLALRPSAEDHLKLAIAYLNLNSAAEAMPQLQAACALAPWDQGTRQVYDKLRARQLVLAVDDSKTVQRIVALTLEKRGYRVTVASDGMQALAKLDEELPALILLDISMPRMDGYQVCKVIRDNKFTRHIPIVMLSGKDGFFDKVKGRLAGATGYITKPFEGDDLAKEVAKFVKTKS